LAALLQRFLEYRDVQPEVAPVPSECAGRIGDADADLLYAGDEGLRHGG
jgi:hypothetical protein